MARPTRVEAERSRAGPYASWLCLSLVPRRFFGPRPHAGLSFARYPQLRVWADRIRGGVSRRALRRWTLGTSAAWRAPGHGAVNHYQALARTTLLLNQELFSGEADEREIADALLTTTVQLTADEESLSC